MASPVRRPFSGACQLLPAHVLCCRSSCRPCPNFDRLVRHSLASGDGPVPNGSRENPTAMGPLRLVLHVSMQQWGYPRSADCSDCSEWYSECEPQRSRARCVHSVCIERLHTPVHCTVINGYNDKHSCSSKRSNIGNCHSVVESSGFFWRRWIARM